MALLEALLLKGQRVKSITSLTMFCDGGRGGGGVFSLIIDGTRGRSKLLKDIII